MRDLDFDRLLTVLGILLGLRISPALILMLLLGPYGDGRGNEVRSESR